ncbi:nuclear hormone receptor family member nhr-91-like [Tachypleus tridentatus]|uniref:nuclear hormone receptor family member nhr-91-like n=1 Tax=Tachypleus tridentatus TaxID=6853 RepID=UPI003FD6605F
MFPLLLEWMHKMSLFHDIKLKRRKVDSRCSSDGETNNSSPDSVTTLDSILRKGELGHLTSSFSFGSNEVGKVSPMGRSQVPSRSPVEQPDTNMLEEELEYVEKSPMQSSPSPVPKITIFEGETKTLSIGSQQTQGNSVFDGGGNNDRESALQNIEFRIDKPIDSTEEQGLDLSTPTRLRGCIEELPHLNPHLRAPFSKQSFRHPIIAHGERPQGEEQNISILKVASKYKMPLLIGDISGSGPGRTKMWTGKSSSQSLQLSKSKNTSTTNTLSTEIALTRLHNNSHMEKTRLLGGPVSSQSQASFMYVSTPATTVNVSTTSVRQYGISVVPSNEFSVKESYHPSNRQFGAKTQNVQFTETTIPISKEDELSQDCSRTCNLIEKPPPLGPTPDSQALNLSVSGNERNEETLIAMTPSTSRGVGDDEEEDQPMVCMICEDKATGLHYGIITCEGCKGFFKRTVQNKRVYTCVAEGSCEITKAQRNRCQYCRFQKCLRQGMVLAAVREDRMPGGRNSGAVYNLYKVKYKKHKKGQKNGQVRQEQQKTPSRYPHQEWANGQILKTALTNPTNVMHLRHRLENCVTSSRDRQMPVEQAVSMISQLIECDDFEDVATLSNLQELLSIKYELSEKLCQIGDNIVFKLVQWTKRLPFYSELPVTLHTQLLTHKWHELLVLTTCAYQAIHGPVKYSESSLDQEIIAGLCRLQNCLAAMMGRPITLEQLRLEAGPLVEHLTHLSTAFRRMRLCIEEYVCLKVIIMLNQVTEEYQGLRELEAIQERYLATLRVFIQQRFHQQPNRFNDLLTCLPDIHAAAGLLLQSKMFYVPFILNTSTSR